MPKKKKRLGPKKKRKDRDPSLIGGYRIADLIDTEELAELRGMSEEGVRKAMKGKNAPEKIGKYWPRDLAIRFLDVREVYKASVVDSMTPEEYLATATGSVTPKGSEPTGAPTPQPIGGGDETGNVVSAMELIRLNPGDLVKRVKAEELITRRLANQERKRRLIPRAEVEECLFARAQQAIAFKRQMCLELPPKLVGLERPEMESKLREALDELFRRIATLGDPIRPPDAAVSASPPPAPHATKPSS